MAVQPQKWAVYRLTSPRWSRVGTVRYTGQEPERLAVAMYGRGVALVLMDKTFDKHYARNAK